MSPQDVNPEISILLDLREWRTLCSVMFFRGPEKRNKDRAGRCKNGRAERTREINVKRMIHLRFIDRNLMRSIFRAADFMWTPIAKTDWAEKKNRALWVGIKFSEFCKFSFAPGGAHLFDTVLRGCFGGSSRHKEEMFSLIFALSAYKCWRM